MSFTYLKIWKMLCACFLTRQTFLHFVFHFLCYCFLVSTFCSWSSNKSLSINLPKDGKSAKHTLVFWSNLGLKIPGSSSFFSCKTLFNMAQQYFALVTFSKRLPTAYIFRYWKIGKHFSNVSWFLQRCIQNLVKQLRWSIM